MIARSTLSRVVSFAMLSFAWLVVFAQPSPAQGEPGAKKSKRPAAKFESPLVTTKTKGHAVEVDADITGAKELYLVVTDGGNGFSCDWADWAEPRLVAAVVHGYVHPGRRARRQRGQAGLGIERFDLRPVDFQADDPARHAGALLTDQRRLADEARLVEVHETIESHLERRVLLRRDQGLLAAEEVHFNQEEARLDPHDIERQETRRTRVELLKRCGRHFPIAI